MLRKLTLSHIAVAVVAAIVISGGCKRSETTPQDTSGRDQSEVTQLSTPLADATSQPIGRKSQDSSERPTSEQPLVVPNVLNTQSLVGPLADAYSRIDPRSDGWESEAFGEVANAQLNLLAKQFFAAQPNVGSLVANEFSSPPLFSIHELSVCFQDHGITVRRDVSTEDQQNVAPASSIGPAAMMKTIGQLQALLVSDQHVKFKLYRVEAHDDLVETKVYFHADGASPKGRMEISADWTIVWEGPSADSSSQATNQTPLIREIRVTSTEVVETQHETQPATSPDTTESAPTITATDHEHALLFTDQTLAVLGGEEAYEQQLRFGTDHWRSQLCRDYGLDVVANHGIAIGDVNGDQLEDIYVCQQGGLPNRLFLQQPDGRLKDVSQASGTDWLNYSASALLIDLDNDGDKDLAVAHELHLLLMRNDGTGSFYVERIVPCQAQTFSLAAADYDLDGDLDIYCCGYNQQAASVRAGAMGSPMPYHDAQNGGANSLFRNDGDWQFTNATAETGLDQNNNRFSFAASWEDYDNDGDVDLYVSNDYGRNNLYRNDQGRFTDVAAELNVEDMSAGMSVSWADVNQDGWMDFHVSNMFSAAGNRITYQRQFKDAATGEVKEQFRRHARGNSLFLSDGQGGFRDVSETAGITMGRWAWGSKFCDFNNDGWHDIFVNNGFISTEDTGDL